MHKKVAIIHYLPIDYYPPATNFLDFLSSKSELTCKVFSTYNSKGLGQYNNNFIKIYRFPGSEKIRNRYLRLFYYYYFNVIVFIRLIFLNPSIILYYESYSALPVYWYLRLFGKNKLLWVHNHEYFAKDWYETGMKTVKYYHQLEKKYLYIKAKGLSQTNKYRVELFLRDQPNIDKNKLHIIPNFPPKNWNQYNRKIESPGYPVKTVYIGSISIKSTFIQEYCEWLIGQRGKVTLDIYSYYFDKETETYIDNLNSPYIIFNKKGIDNKKIPEVLLSNQYHVGLILYKYIALNAVYCASNKLFEYTTCGLDVWFTQEMIGTYDYITENTYPKIVKVNFEQMADFNLEKETDKAGCIYKPQMYNYEVVYEEFYNNLI